MLIDSSELADKTTLKSTFCVIGAGAAGITLARELAKAKQDTILLEAGGFEHEPSKHLLYQGEEAGTLISEKSNYLTKTRLRFFGGTTNHWGGWCLPMSSSDFSKRSWISENYWPISKEEIAPYYEHAASILEMAPFAKNWDVERPAANQFENDSLHFYHFHLSPPTRFGHRYRAELKASETIRVITNSTVKKIHYSDNGRRISRLHFFGTGSTEHILEADYFVLACGGIENSRLLLLSDSQAKTGIGNQHDLVGRYFMEHPHLPVGGLLQVFDEKVDTTPFDFQTIGGTKNRARPVLSLTPKAQAKNKLANCCLTINKIAARQLPESTQADTELLKDLLLGTEARSFFGTIFVQFEQTPEANNRVSLSHEVDELGLRKVKLNWELGEIERRTVDFALRALAELTGSRGLGRVKLATSPDQPWRGAKGGSHHMGTTIMGSQATNGVVDRNCRVFSTDNLFIAGSSVFPVGGIANPTFTIVALALRLSEHLIGLGER